MATDDWTRDEEFEEWWAAGRSTASSALAPGRPHYRPRTLPDPVRTHKHQSPPLAPVAPGRQPFVEKPAVKRSVVRSPVGKHAKPRQPNRRPAPATADTSIVKRVRALKVAAIAVPAAGLILAMAVTIAGWVSSPTSWPGSLQYPTTVQLNFASAGPVGAILVIPGQRVYKGEAVAVESKPGATQAYADQQRVVAADLAVLDSLKVPPSASPDRIASAEATVAASQAQLDQDEAAVEALTLTSPIAGVVTSVGGSVGDVDQTTGVPAYTGLSGPFEEYGMSTSQHAAADGGATSAQAATALITISAGQPVAVATVSEAEASRLRIGTPVSVRIGTLHRQVSGSISEVAQTPIYDGRSVRYPVEVTVSSWPASLLPGMSLSVTVR